LLAEFVHAVIACPVCKQGLEAGDDRLLCRCCRQEYWVRDGIPCLFPSQDQLTVDPAVLRIKSRQEAARTIDLSRRIDAGFLSRPRAFYGIYAIFLVTLLARVHWGSAAVGALLLADWIVYRRRRRRVLRAFEENPVRLRTIADILAVDQMYDRAGRPQPTMDDCVRLAWESGAPMVPEEHWRAQTSERYLDILTTVRSLPIVPGVVADIGCGDGQACWDFGLGRDATLIGVEASRLLLRKFRDKLPDQVALQADGACLPLQDGCVDFLWCTEVLEHLPDPHKAVGEFLRVLRPHGVFVVQSPNAHRLRNLNPFELLTLLVSLISDSVLQKKVLHENTWHNASTYHWDFSVQDYRRMLVGRSARVVELSSREFFCPQVLLRGSIERFRAKERILRSLPLLKWMGGDLTMVVRKEPG
jgi:SAM-dependent methyltransferase/uncharacterized protein YbaR (Trm112 family)